MRSDRRHRPASGRPMQAIRRGRNRAVRESGACRGPRAPGGDRGRPHRSSCWRVASLDCRLASFRRQHPRSHDCGERINDIKHQRRSIGVTVTIANESIVLTASPGTALIDEPVQLRACGLPPAASLILRAFLTDSLGTPWTSHGSVGADARGTVAVDCEELITSLTMAEPRRPFDGTSIAPLRMEIVAELSGRAVAQVDLRRQYLADGVRRTELSDRNRS